MNLTPKEEERLTIFMAAELARRRKDRGVKLNHPEAVAYISDYVIEGARDGRSVAQLRSEATRLLSREDVMDGVPEMIPMIQVEPMFPDGTKLVTVHDPIRLAEPPEDSDPTDAAEATGTATDAAESTETATDGGDPA